MQVLIHTRVIKNQKNKIALKIYVCFVNKSLKEEDKQHETKKIIKLMLPVLCFGQTQSNIEENELMERNYILSINGQKVIVNGSENF